MLKLYSVNTTEAGGFGQGVHLTLGLHVMIDYVFYISRITEHQNMNICTSTLHFLLF